MGKEGNQGTTGVICLSLISRSNVFGYIRAKGHGRC